MVKILIVFDNRRNYFFLRRGFILSFFLLGTFHKKVIFLWLIFKPRCYLFAVAIFLFQLFDQVQLEQIFLLKGPLGSNLLDNLCDVLRAPLLNRAPLPLCCLWHLLDRLPLPRTLRLFTQDGGGGSHDILSGVSWQLRLHPTSLPRYSILLLSTVYGRHCIECLFEICQTVPFRVVYCRIHFCLVFDQHLFGDRCLNFEVLVAETLLRVVVAA